MNTGDMIFIVLGAISILTGLLSLLTGKVYNMGSSANQYTEESLARYARPTGVASLLAGTGLVLDHLVNNHLFFIGGFSVSVGFAAMIVCFITAVVIYIASNRLLVKKAAC